METVLPMYAWYIKWIKETFPTLNLDCPQKAGPTYVTNWQFEYLGNETIKMFTAPFYGSFFPNGVYRNTIKFYTKTDPMAYMFQYFIEHRVRLGDEIF